jgi:hypothetical protein
MKQTIEKSNSNDSVQLELEKLKKLVENNRKNKDKWKKLILDVTAKLEKKIKNLLDENYELKKSKRRS